MPKSMFVDPKEQFAKRTITFEDIPVCEYDKTVKDEKDNFTKEEFMGMYADMVAIREFETMLQTIKQQGEYNGKKFTYPGPAHLAIGEEATAVGQAFTLGVDDFIFGTHRSHHEVIAKALSAIRKLSDDELEKIMKDIFQACYAASVECGRPGDMMLGANVAGFLKVANAMMAQGIV